MPQPVFSVLSTAREHEAYLAEMIDSVIAQTFSDWELIVVDNGMSDEVVRIVEKYSSDPRIKLLRSEEVGVGPGVDTAAAAAAGEFFTVLHGNGRLLPKFFERTYAVAQADPAIDVVTVDARGFTDDGATQPRSFRQEGGVEVEPGVGHRVTMAEFIDGSVLYYTAAIRAAAWKQVDGYGSLPMVEGLRTFARMLTAGSDIRVLPEHLAGYRLPEDPAKFPIYEDNLQKAFLEVDSTTSDPAVHAAVDRKLREARFHQAMRKARAAIASSDTRTAREQTRIALKQKRALKPAVIYAALTVAPGGLRRVRAAKQRLRG